MNQIVELVAPENKAWVAKLTPQLIANLLDDIANLHVDLIPPAVQSRAAADIGKVGELTFGTIIQEYMSRDYKLIDTAKQGYKGDFIIEWESLKTNKKYSLLIDVKNYQSTVPKLEIDKFYRDIRLNSAINCGMMLSLKSKISGINKVVDFQEFMGNSITPVMFVSTKQPEIISETIKLIFHIIEIKDLTNNSIDNENFIIKTINDLNSDIEIISQCKYDLQNARAEIEKSLDRIMFSLMKCEFNLVDKINKINSALCKKVLIEHHEEKKLDEVKTIMTKFGSALDLDSETLLYTIFNQKWEKTETDIVGRKWFLHKSNSTKVTVKFTKKTMTMIFSVINPEMTKIIGKKSHSQKADGIHLLINSKNIETIIQLCTII